MDLFIETPERAAERLERERRLQEAWMASLQQGEAGARRMQLDGVPEVRSSSEAGRRAAEAGYSASAERERKQEERRPGGGPQQEGERRPSGERLQEERRPSSERPWKARGFGRRRRRENDARAEAGSYSVAQEAYREELAYDKRRARRRKLFAVVRAVCLLVGIPLLLVAVFVGSYVFTCIFNGATPGEVVELLSEMATRCVSFFAQIGWGS